MGTDIHLVAQKKNDNGSFDFIKTEYEEDRHYMLFAWLADVRNGYGFAGVPMHEPLTPIAEPRGVPDDFRVARDGSFDFPYAMVSERNKQYYTEEEWAADSASWLGDHSHSWFTFDEILEAYQTLKERKVLKTGVIDIEIYNKWDGEEPKDYCGDIFGRNIVVDFPNDITNNTTHVRVEWKKSVYSEFDYFIDEIKRLKEIHGDGRIVFGFDS